MDRGPWQAVVHSLSESNTTEVTWHASTCLVISSLSDFNQQLLSICGLSLGNTNYTCYLFLLKGFLIFFSFACQFNERWWNVVERQGFESWLESCQLCYFEQSRESTTYFIVTGGIRNEMIIYEWHIAGLTNEIFFLFSHQQNELLLQEKKILSFLKSIFPPTCLSW